MATITWNNSNGGNWNAATDWTPNQVPGASDDAEITANGTYTVTITSNVAIGTLTTAPGATLAISNGDTLTWTTGSTITNNGTITLNSAGSPTKISLNGTQGGTITLDGSGALVLGNDANNSIEADQFNLTFDNNSTIEGSGSIGTNVNLILNNTGTINADQSTPLILQPSLNNSSPTANTGTLEATNGGTLELDGIITNTGGLIQATGTGSVVSLVSGVSITDGTLTSSNGGVIHPVNGSLSGTPTITTGSTISVPDGDTLTLNTGSTITNNGTIELNSAGTKTRISLNGTNGGTITLDGSGVVVLGNNANNAIEADQFNLTFVNNSTIEGSGGIGTNVNLNLDNTGTIDADQSTPLILQPSLNNSSPTANTGTLEATNGGTLELEGIITNTGGLIQATGTNSLVSLVNGVSVTGGTLTSSNGGVIQSVNGSLSGTPTITTGSTISVLDGNTLTLNTGSTITNNGTIALNSAGTKTRISLNGTQGGTITLDGSGVLVLGNGANNSIEADQFSLTFDNNSTIEGSGGIGTNVNLVLNNTGTIDADQSTPLILQPSLNNSSPTANTGTLEATNGGTLQIEGIVTNTGTVLATGTGSTVLLDAGVVTNDGLFEALSGGLLNVTNPIAGTGQLEIGSGSEVELGGATSETAMFTGAANAKLRLGMPGSYTGTIVGFAPGDILELANTNATTATPTLNGSNTTLTVSLNGGGTLAYTLAGNLANDIFPITHVGSDSDITIQPQLAGQISLAAATEGVALPATTTVASFTDTNAGDTASTFSATIAWGDGSTTAGTVTGSNGAFAVSGGHTYADEGSDALSVTVTANSTSLPLSGTVAVAEADALTPQGVTFAANPGQAFSGTVATFTDSNTTNVAGDFGATIAWGDGTTSAGTVTGSNGSFTVSGTHTYAASGQDAVSVTLTDDAPGTATATASSTANVGAQLAGQISLAAATEGVALPATTTVASFSDTNASDTASTFTAAITWGDGTTTAGTVSGSNGSFTVNGGHTYADEGSDALSVTITDTANNATLPLNGSVAVAEADAQTPQGITFAANPGQAFTGTVATFTDSNAANVAADLSATITWGDGTTTAGTVTGSNGSFTVNGTHTYAASGQDAVTVTLTDDAPGTATAIANSTANVGPQLAGQISLAAATEGVALPATTTVASFSDTNAGDTAATFAASINWGDGSTSTGTVAGSNGSFTVNGGHTYADEGSEALSVTITDTANNVQLPLSGTVAVAEADVLTPQGVTFAANPGQAFTGTVATFSDSNVANVAGDFAATINWGDGTTTAGTVTGSNDSFTVSGTHTYAVQGTDAVSVTLIDDAPGTATAIANSTANVGAQLAGQISLASATEGVALPATTTVASFSDTNAGDTAATFSATIAWGDGSTTAGTMTGSNGSFAVSGGHTYADEGSDALSVTVTDTANNVQLPLSGTVAVAEADVLTPQGITFTANPGQAFSGTVATFSDGNVANVARDFAATINWGDGTTTAGVITDTADAIAVSGTHTYAGSGQNAVAVTVADDTPGTATATANGTANVGPQFAGQISLASATEGVALPATTTVASFTDTNASDTASAFTVAINWGDGTTSTGTVSGSNGAFTVTGGHTYADEGSDALSVTVTDNANNTTLPLSGTVAVAEADVLTPQGTTFTANPGQAFTGTVATFSDSNTANVAGDFAATINWGDGTTTAETVSGSNGAFTVSGTHTYAASGQDAVTVTLTDNAPGTATATASSTANVSNAPPVLGGAGNTVYWTQNTTQNAPAIAIDSALTVAGATVTGATVSISIGFLSGDRLNFINQNGITGSYNATAGVLTLSGAASAEAYQAALESVTFGSTSANPTSVNLLNGVSRDSTRTITWTASDGTASSTPVTSTVDVGQTYVLTAGSNTIHAGVGNDVIIAPSGNTLNSGDAIDGGGGANTLIVEGPTSGAPFNNISLQAPGTLANIGVIDIESTRFAIITLRDGLDATVNVSAPAFSQVVGAQNADVINLEGSNPYNVVVGDAAETVHGGSGPDFIGVTPATIGATIDGGTSGQSELFVTGLGGTMTMGSNITDINTVVLESVFRNDFTTNGIPGLRVIDLTRARDETLRAGGPNQTLEPVLAFGSTRLVGASQGGTTFLYVNPQAPTAKTIENFAAPNDVIDLNYIASSPSPPTLSFHQTDPNSGTLTVTSSRFNSTITLLGQFIAAGFHASPDGHGGTDITYQSPQAASTQSLLAPSHA